MYWNPNNHSSMESLLDKHDTKLETLLAIDNILLQVKNGDKKLISFLSQPDHLMKLFSYSVATNLPEDKAIKYPYVACEIICADNGRFIEVMRRNTNIMTPLWSFLQEMKPRTESTQVNNSVTGNSPSAIQNGSIFFSRLNIFLFNKMLGTMITFLNDRVPDAIDLLVANLDLQPISELLYRFYALYNGENEVLGWLQRGGLYEKLADQLSPCKGPDLHVATLQFIKGLFALPFPESYPRDQVIGPFLTATWLTRLLENIFVVEEECEDDEESALLNGLGIIATLLASGRDFNLESFVGCLMSHFDTFYDLLKQPGTERYMNLTAGRVRVFGRIRLTVVEVFLELLGSILLTRDSEAYIRQLERAKLLPTLLDAFFGYPQNNLLHELIVRMFRLLFDANARVFDPIIDQVLKEYNLRQRIVDAQRENDAQVQRPRGNRLPFMGHLTLLAESIINWEADAASKDVTTCSFVVSPVPEESWREYSSKSFRETRLKDKKVLGGIRPPASMNEMFSSSDDSGDELLNYNSVFRSGDEEQLARYFCQQLIGNFPDHFLDDDRSDEDSEDDEVEFVFESKTKKHASSTGHKGIEIPVLMSQDDFDEEMFDDSFTSALFSDDSEDSEDIESDEDTDEDMDSESDNDSNDSDYDM